MKENCPCPCPEYCRGLAMYCKWAAEVPQDPIKMKHICGRSALGQFPSGSTVAIHSDSVIVTPGKTQRNTQTGNVTIAGQAGTVHTIPLQLSSDINKKMYACPHFVSHSGCGCGLARCKIGKGKLDPNTNDGSGLVKWIDCAACLFPDEEVIQKIAAP